MKLLTCFYSALPYLFTTCVVLSSLPAVASNDTQPGVGGFATFIPLILMYALFFVLALPIIKRKGRKKSKWFFLMITPIVNAFAFAFLCSYTDQDVLQRLEALEKEVHKPDWKTSNTNQA